MNFPDVTANNGSSVEKNPCMGLLVLGFLMVPPAVGGIAGYITSNLNIGLGVTFGVGLGALGLFCLFVAFACITKNNSEDRKILTGHSSPSYSV